jgi:hypothetical protein
VFSLSAAVASSIFAQVGQTTAVAPERRAEVIGNYLHLPLAFEKQGRAAGDRYVARGQGYLIGLQGAIRVPRI